MARDIAFTVLQTIDKDGPLFHNGTNDHGPFLPPVFALQPLENEYFRVARTACKCVSWSEVSDRVGSLTIDAWLVYGRTRRRVRLCRELSDLDMNEPLKSVTKGPSDRSKPWSGESELPKQLVLGRRASFAML